MAMSMIPVRVSLPPFRVPMTLSLFLTRPVLVRYSGAFSSIFKNRFNSSSHWEMRSVLSRRMSVFTRLLAIR